MPYFTPCWNVLYEWSVRQLKISDLILKSSSVFLGRTKTELNKPDNTWRRVFPNITAVHLLDLGIKPTD
jgi:hypothetical protein